MAEQAQEFREQLLNFQEMSPSLRDAYRKELDAMLHPPMTARTGLPGTFLLIILVAAIILLIRVPFVHRVSPLLLCGQAVLAGAFVWAAALIVRDLLKRRHSPKSVSAIAGVLTVGAGTLTVVALLMGLHAPSDPKSLFGAFYAFVFYFACAIWGLESRIGAAELAAREQSLRIEYRLADLADRLQK